MPLRAIVGGKTIIAPDISDEEWDDLVRRHKKGLPVTMACCGAAGHLRTSKAGTRHFYHAADTECHYEEESKEHLEIKYLIYRICKSEGWEVCVEYPAPDHTWISDVFAKRDGRKVVFEVQISAISMHDLEERDRKYRDEEIESYWLLENFLGSSKEFASSYNALLNEDDNRGGKKIPYLDTSIFDTGPENHLFIAKGIRCVGLNAGKQAVFTTHKPELLLADWVRYVLNGNYPDYLENTAAAFHHNRQLKNLAAPILLRFRDFYDAIVRHETYRKKIDRYHRIVNGDTSLSGNPSLRKKLISISAEIDWLDNEYRLFVSESYGLFRWKKIPDHDAPVPVFRLESEAKIQGLKQCVETLTRWEASFNAVCSGLEKELPIKKR